MHPPIEGIDHIHLHVRNRREAEAWYARVLGLVRTPELAFWSEEAGGPLTLEDPRGRLHLALFEVTEPALSAGIAFNVSATAFTGWKSHLETVLGQPLQAVDHTVSWSLYFQDPDGNRFEITCYAHADLNTRLAAAADV